MRHLVLTLSMGLIMACGLAARADKADGAVCHAGTAKSVCCKTSKADCGPYVSCCEVGNKPFFTSTQASKCDLTRPRSLDGSPAKVSSCSQVGNGAFFLASRGKDCGATNALACADKSSASACCAKGKAEKEASACCAKGKAEKASACCAKDKAEKASACCAKGK